MYNIVISYEVKECNSLFGGSYYGAMKLTVTEDAKNKIINAFSKGDQHIAINIGNDTIRYLNMKNVMFIDVSAQKDNQ